MQETQVLKAKIIALLDFLPADSLKLLAEFAAFLQTRASNSARGENLMVQEERAEMNFEVSTKPRQKPARVISPRLAHPEQIVDFKMEVIEESSNDRL
jgi:hypothetical protein